MYKHIWTQRTVLSLEKQDGRELWRKPAKILQEPTSKQSANKAVLQHTNTNSTSTKWLAATKQECWKIGMAQKWLMSPCLEQLHKQKILYLPHPVQIKTCSPQKPAFPPLQLLNCHQELYQTSQPRKTNRPRQRQPPGSGALEAQSGTECVTRGDDFLWQSSGTPGAVANV